MEKASTISSWTSRRSRTFPNRRPWPLLVALSLLCVAPWIAGRQAAAAESPQDVVGATAQQVIDILGDKQLSSDEKRGKIEAVVYERVDFPTLCRLVLAKNWGRLTPAQQQEFMAEFKKHLSVTYGRNVDNYKNEKVAVIGSREEAKGDYTVLTKVVRGGTADIVVDYRLRQKDGTWLIIDIIIEGVSLVSNFRSQFQQIIANGGPEKLIELLREKNVKGEPLKS